MWLLQSTEQVDNNKAWKLVRSLTHFTILSGIYTWVVRFTRGYSRVWGKRKNTLEEWNNNKPISTHQSWEPTLRNSQAFYPYPQSIPAPAQKKRPVFEDACRGGLCSGHRITVWVTGLDTSVRCYPITHILTGPFWLGPVSDNHRTTAHWHVCELMMRNNLDMRWLWMCLLVKGKQLEYLTHR